MFQTGLTYQKTITMITETCCNCGISFGMPSDFRENCLLEGPAKSFYCPNGHSQCFSKSKAQVVEERMKKEKLQIEAQLEAVHNKFLDEMNLRKKAETKLKRVHKGVCPCCNRTFQNLQSHMKTKHPEQQKIK